MPAPSTAAMSQASAARHIDRWCSSIWRTSQLFDGRPKTGCSKMDGDSVVGVSDAAWSQGLVGGVLVDDVSSRNGTAGSLLLGSSEMGSWLMPVDSTARPGGCVGGVRRNGALQRTALLESR